MSNNTSLYSTTSSGNVTIPPNNNTGLYNATGVPATVDNNINITGNISAAGNITGGNILTEGIVSAAGNIYADNFIGNIVANIQVPGGNTQILYNNEGAANASANLTFNSATNVLYVAGQVSATGNVAGNYILGNGSQLTGLPATYTDANVVSLLNAFGSNTVSTTGNVTAGYFLGDGSQLTNLPAGNYSNANVAAYLPTYTGNITGDQVSLTGNIIANYIYGDGSQITNLPVGNYSNANVAAYLPTYTGNLAAGIVSATGNITGSYILGNGSQLTGLPATYSNANVATFLANFGSNAISTTGNVTAGYVFGNGSQLTGLPATYSNANVATFLAAFGSNSISTTGTVTAANFVGGGSALSNITGANVTGTVGSATTAATVTTNAQPNITSVGTLTSVTSTGNVTGGNILTGGAVSAAGNVSGLFIKGDGSQLTNLPPGNYSNANVAAYLPTYTGNIAAGNVSATGNITAAFLKTSGATGNIIGVNYVSANFYLGDGGYLSNIQAGNLVGAYSNANVANYLPTFSGNLTANTISATGNITGNYILGNGSQLTGLPATYGNANVAAYLPTYTGNLLAGNASVTGQVAITTAGNTWRFLNDTFTTPDGGTWTSNTVSNDEFINSAPNGYINLAALHANNQIATSFHLEQTVAQIEVDQSLWSFENGNITLPGNTSAINYANGVSILTGIPGTYSNANVANYLPTYSGTITANVVSATGNITGSYIIGNGSQLTGLPAGYSNTDVNNHLATFGSNTISTTGNITAGYFVGNGSLLSNISGANVDGQVANAAYATLAGDASYATSAGTANTVTSNAQGNITSVGTLTGLDVGGAISATGNITGNYFVGNGSLLTGITATSNAAGNNTQIQYNANGAFAGNAIMTFNDTTGVVTLGNIVMANLNINSTTANIDTANIPQFGNSAWRITVGNLYNGSANSIYAGQSPGNVLSAMNPRLLISDLIYVGNNNNRMQETTTMTWFVANANITNALNRYAGSRTEVMYGGGPSGNVWNVGGVFGMNGSTNQLFVGAGTNANLSAVGNTVSTSGAFTGTFSGIAINNYSTANIAVGVFSQINTNNANASAFGNATNQIAYYANFGGQPANANVVGTTTAVAYYMAGTTGIAGTSGTNGNIARQATNYHAFRNDDDLARSRLGSLERFHELNANVTSSSGNITVNKQNGQVQQIYMTENVSGVTFSNFVTRVQKPDATQVNQADTVTLIIQQGATPYSFTLPTGNANIRYAGGISTVGNTANSTTMVSITGVYNYNTSSNQYLITVSPEFS